MRILHVIPSISAASGGPAHAVFGMCRGLIAAGHNLTLATTTARLGAGLSAEEICRREAVPAVVFGCQTPPHFSLSVGLARWLASNVRQFDVVHVHALFTFPSSVACAIARHAGVPYVVRPLGVLSPYAFGRHAWRKQMYLDCVDRGNIDGAAALHFTSAAEKDEAEGLGFRGAAFVLPHGVDGPAAVSEQSLTEFRRQHDLEGKLCLLYLGRLDPVKGLERMVEALGQARGELGAWRWLIAGGGEAGYIQELRRRVQQSPISPNVEFLGEVAGTKKETCFAATDIFLLPSYHENFSMSLAEAMRRGLPVVTTEAVGIAPYIAEKCCGFVTNGSIAELAQATKRLALGPEIRQEMGNNGRRTAQRQFSWQIIAQELAAIYRRITTANGRVDFAGGS